MEESICQSCGMPLRREDDFGTNQDASKNPEYCHYCYKEGRFVDEGISMEDKIKKIVKIAVKFKGVPKEEAIAKANEVIPKLKRWQDDLNV